jgi:hypothetical protein
MMLPVTRFGKPILKKGLISTINTRQRKKEPRNAALKVKQGEKSDHIPEGNCLSPEALDGSIIIEKG